MNGEERESKALSLMLNLDPHNGDIGRQLEVCTWLEKEDS